ncbi:hypothetical protein OPV22_018666 [Ensete ventricosum]|uniref:Uncharacterized protein n=1 Tax=Ensete ventricosum TaxID=4639 RepID=A0AAV8QW53_ENSVE|nr:hypothetical protein OPV22_018666 [Ensete ventricosum]
MTTSTRRESPGVFFDLRHPIPDPRRSSSRCRNMRNESRLWSSAAPFASKSFASHHHQNHHRSDRRPRRGPTATSWGLDLSYAWATARSTSPLLRPPTRAESQHRDLKYKAGWLKGATYYYKSCQL